MAEHANSTTMPEVQALPSLEALSISGLSGRHLMAVYDALTAVDEAAIGILNQPRCRGRDEYSPGGQVIESLMEWAGRARDAVVEAADRAISTDRAEAEYCRWVVVKHRALLMGDLSDVACAATARLQVAK
mgnify:CR=1 FL=1